MERGLGPGSVEEELQKRANRPSEEGVSWTGGVAFWGLTGDLAGLLQWRGTRLGWGRTRGGDSASFALWTFCSEESRTVGMGRNDRAFVGWWQERRVCSARSLGGRGLGYRMFMSPARTLGQPEGPAADWAPMGQLSRLLAARAEALRSSSHFQRLGASAPAERAEDHGAGGTCQARAGNGPEQVSGMPLTWVWLVGEATCSSCSSAGCGRGGGWT